MLVCSYWCGDYVYAYDGTDAGGMNDSVDDWTFDTGVDESCIYDAALWRDDADCHYVATAGAACEDVCYVCFKAF